ncbi:MAG: DUF2298 domain-containing protein [Chloroflexota bacterium]|nr:DUF2298 domain-containing protein [Dehalococcoidia bacterium]MDW8252757.1 DUF2298 domain-containing protein [Chloroflexota bacterium]
MTSRRFRGCLSKIGEAARLTLPWPWLGLAGSGALGLGLTHAPEAQSAAASAVGGACLLLTLRAAAGAGPACWLAGLSVTALAVGIRAEAGTIALLAGPAVASAMLAAGRWTTTSALALGIALGSTVASTLAALLLLPAAIVLARGAGLAAQRDRRRALDDAVLGIVVSSGAAILSFIAVATVLVGSREALARRVALELLQLQGVAPAPEAAPAPLGLAGWLAVGLFVAAQWWRRAEAWRKAGALLLLLPAVVLCGPARQVENGMLVVIAALAGPVGHALALSFAKRRRLALATAAFGGAALLTLGSPRIAFPAGPLAASDSHPASGLLQSAERLAANASALPWNVVFDLPWQDGPLVVLVWYAALAGMAAAALPLVALAARPLPDWGFALARPFGLLLCGWLAWLAASIPIAPFDRLTILGAAAGTAVLSLAVLIARRDLRSGVQERWRQLVGWELIFSVSFLGFVGIRALNPDLWFPLYGGEKPMDLAILTAVTRSTYFPPTDPWFAGGTLNYYYFGQLLVGTVARLTGIAPEVAYNLAIATLFAMTVTGAASLGSNLAALGGWPRGRRPAALLSALFVAVVGNLDLPIQLLSGLARGEGLAFDYWNSSRMMPEQNTITEFPFFSFLFADLHAHVIALPLTLVVLGLATALACGGGVATASAAGLVVGALRATNGWDYPTSLGISVSAAFIPLLRDASVRALVRAALLALLVAAAGWIAFRPFTDSFELFYRWVVASTETTPLRQYLAIHGLFVFAFVTLLFFGLRDRARAMWAWRRGLLIAGIGLGCAAAAGFATAVFVLLLAAGWLWYWGHHAGTGEQRAGRAMLALIGLVGLVLSAAVDLLTLAGDPTRTNTVFKFLFQAWTLLALGAGQATALTLPLLLKARTPLRAAWAALGGLLFGAALLWPIAATPARIAQRFVLLPPTLDGLAYHWSATYHDERGPVDLRAEREAIEWLRLHGGLASILEGQTPAGAWGARFSVHTGMPAVLGWEFHQTQQRYGYRALVAARARDVNRFYASGDPATVRDVLARYRPAFIAVGELEARRYPASGLEAIRSLEGSVLEVAYRNPTVTIYRLREDQP